jgi:hypothetical protein
MEAGMCRGAGTPGMQGRSVRNQTDLTQNGANRSNQASERDESFKSGWDSDFVKSIQTGFTNRKYVEGICGF